MCVPSALYKYDVSNGNLFVLGWVRVRRVCRGSVSFVMFICGSV